MRYFLLLLPLIAGQAWGAMPAGIPDQLDPMEGVDLICPMSATVTVNLNTKAHQVWFAEPGARQGQALALSSFEVLRCPWCFRFVGMIETDGLRPGEVDQSMLQGTTRSEGFGTPGERLFLDIQVLSGPDTAAQKKNIPCYLAG